MLVEFYSRLIVGLVLEVSLDLVVSREDLCIIELSLKQDTLLDNLVRLGRCTKDKD